ncbi:MAG: lipopolysaccharide biosynthesis protein [Oceanicaulis sp.]
MLLRFIRHKFENDDVLRKLAGKGLPALVIKVATAGLSFAMFVFLARWLGPLEYGRYAMLFSLGTFLGFVSVGGLHTLVLRRLPALEHAGASGDAIALVRDGYLGVLGISALLGAITLAVALAGGAMGMPWQAPLIACALAAPFALAEYQSHVLRGWSSVNLALLPRDVLWRIGVLAIVGFAAAQGASITALQAFGWTSGLLLALAAVQFALGLRRAPPGGFAAARPVRPAPAARVLEARWLWAAAMAGALLPQLSVVVVGALSSAVDAGIFFAAQKTSALLSLPLVAANMIGAPMIARAWAAGDRAGVQRICTLIVIGVTAPTLAGVALFAVAGGQIMALFDPSYGAYKTLLLIFAAGALVNALCGPTGFLMLMTGHERPFVVILIVSQTLGLSLAAAGALTYGLIGAAIGEAVGIAMWNILVWAWARRTLGVDPTVLGIVRVGIE